MTKKARKSRAATRRQFRPSAKSARAKTVRAKPARTKSKVSAGRGRAKPKRARDSLDDFIDAAATALALPIAPAWLPAIKANLEVTLRMGALVGEFTLPDDAEPAPVYEA